MNSAEKSSEGIPLLREALELVTASANVGNHRAQENLPVIQIKLGIALANSAERSPDDIPLLRETLKSLKYRANAGNHWAQENIPAVQAALEHFTNLTLGAGGSTP